MGTVHIDNCVQGSEEMGAFLLGLKCLSLEDEEDHREQARIGLCGF